MAGLNKTQNILLVGSFFLTAVILFFLPKMDMFWDSLVSEFPKEGIHKTYYENGNVQAEFEIRDYEYNGKAKLFNEGGKLTTEIEYKNGKANGKATAYFPDGKIQEVSRLKNGMYDGEALSYYETGTLKAKETYKDDVLLERIRYREDQSAFSKYTPDKGETAADILFYF